MWRSTKPLRTSRSTTFEAVERDYAEVALHVAQVDGRAAVLGDEVDHPRVCAGELVVFPACASRCR